MVNVGLEVTATSIPCSYLEQRKKLLVAMCVKCMQRTVGQFSPLGETSLAATVILI